MKVKGYTHPARDRFLLFLVFMAAAIVQRRWGWWRVFIVPVLSILFFKLRARMVRNEQLALGGE